MNTFTPDKYRDEWSRQRKGGALEGDIQSNPVEITAKASVNDFCSFFAGKTRFNKVLVHALMDLTPL